MKIRKILLATLACAALAATSASALPAAAVKSNPPPSAQLGVTKAGYYYDSYGILYGNICRNGEAWCWLRNPVWLPVGNGCVCNPGTPYQFYGRASTS